MNILTGMYPGEATQLAAKSLARLARTVPPTPAAAVIQLPKILPPPTLSRCVAAEQVLLDHPSLSRTEVAEICGCSTATVDKAVHQLKARGALPQGRRECPGAVHERILEVLKANGTATPEQVATEIGETPGCVSRAMGVLRRVGRLRSTVTYRHEVIE